MEADVALHAPEKWATGDPRFDQPEKVKYIYSGRRKEKDTRTAARMQMKASKSYDNELETSVAREHALGSRGEVTKVKDDLNLRYGNRMGHDQGMQDRRYVQPHAHTAATAAAPVMQGQQSRGNVDGVSSPGGRKEKWKPKEKSPAKKTSHRARHKRAAAADSQTEMLRGEEGFHSQMTPVFQESSEKPIPVEFHLKEDQLTMFGPKMQNMRPSTLSSSSSVSSPSSLKEKPSSLVILEVKDGPTFFYKPSDRMVTDTGVGYDSAVLPFSSSNVTSADSSSNIPGRRPSNSAFGITAESTPLTVFRKASIPDSVSVGSFSVGATASPIYGSPKARHGVSQLPRTSGLRKPDLSVLNTPPSKCKGIGPGNEIAVGISDTVSSQIPVMTETNTDLENTALGSALLPESPVLTLPPPLEFQDPVVMPQISTPEDKVGASRNFAAVAIPEIGRESHDRSHESNVVHPSFNEPPLESVGFQNISEILQQKAGIKHDDIIVGPRRPRSYASHGEVVVGQGKESPSEYYESFLGNGLTSPAANRTPTSQAVLSLSTDALYSGQPILSLKSDSVTPKDAVTKSKLPSLVKSSTAEHGKGATKHFFKPEQPQKHDHRIKSLDDLQNNNVDMTFTAERAQDGKLLSEPQTPYTTGERPGDERWRPKERKSGLQKPKRGKKDDSVSAESGYATDILRPEIPDIASLKIPADSVYNTKSLDRGHRSFGEAKTKSKSATSSPAKQLHSPKSKSSTSTPTKKQHALPKLHMLSNIPVPISHDPPAKRNSYHKPQTVSDAAEASVPSTSKEELIMVSMDSPVSSAAPKLENVESLSSSPIASSQPNKASAAASPRRMTEISKVSELEMHNRVDVKPAVSATDDQHSLPTSSTLPDQACVSHTVGSNKDQTTKGEVLSSTAAAGNDLNETAQQIIDDLPSSMPVKPRLHRSAEHLFGDAKLSIFNSTDNIEHFQATNATKSRPFNDQPKPERPGVDSLSPLKKNHGLAKIGIMRRGSDRTGMCRRGSDRAIVPISRNDPSVEDLKNANSLKELCQSVASLLNIDNERAEKMLTTSLSQRQDLVEGLDADAILDYLSHHGVLDPDILVGLDDDATKTQRNSVLLRHVEEHGNTAVALFINALRQSGQLHLASSLDTEQRIKPVSGDGYFGKDRHKGEVTIRIEIEALKILAPREPRSDKIVDASLLASPSDPSKLGDDGVLIKDDVDEDYVKPRSCWCFCFSRKSKAKSSSKKEMEKKKKADPKKQGVVPAAALSDADLRFPDGGETDGADSGSKRHRTKSKEKIKKGKDEGPKSTAAPENVKPKDQSKTRDKDNAGKKSKSSKAKSKSSGKYSVPEAAAGQESDQCERLDSVPDVAFRSGKENVIIAGGKHSSNGDHRAGYGDSDACHAPRASSQPYSPQPQSHNGNVHSPSSSSHGLKPDKDNWDPIIMEYDPRLELVKLRAGQEELASPTRQSGNLGIMCEQWKSGGRHFLQKASLLCDKIIQELQTDIIKYFEQDRGTLVLDVISDTSAILVINICMKRAQVNRLQQEVKDESLLNKMQDMFFSKVDISTFDIRGVKLRIILDEREVDIALSELS